MWVVVVIAAIILIWIIGNYVRFRGAEGIRRAMRISYKKHFDRHRSDVQRGLKGWDMEALERGLNVERERLQQEAGKFVGRFEIVQGTVKDVADKGANFYINFGEDWRTDFTLTIEGKARRLFREMAFDPLLLKGKTIRVRGWLKSFNGPMIAITHPEQIEILD